MDQAAKLRKLADERGVVISLKGMDGNKDLNQEKNIRLTEPHSAPQTPKKEQMHPRIITVTSGKGGVGKTSVTVNLAIMLARLGKKVTILDADLGMANVNLLVGFIPKFNLQHVFKGQKRIEDIIIEIPEGIKIIAGASGFYQLANMEDERREDLISEINSALTGDIVLVDTGAGVSANVLSFILAANEALVITTPEPTAIADAYGIIKAIVSQTSDMSIKLLVNRTLTAMEGKKVADRIINIASQFLSSKVDNIGFIFDDPVVSRAVHGQKPFVVTFPKSKASGCVRSIAANLLNMDLSDIEERKDTFMERIVRFLGKDEN